MNYELERIWKVAVCGVIEVQFQYFRAGLRKPRKFLGQDSLCPNDIGTEHSTIPSRELYPNEILRHNKGCSVL
jgi:hypothetical protein